MDGVDVARRGSDVGAPTRGEEEGRRLWCGERRGEERRGMRQRCEEKRKGWCVGSWDCGVEPEEVAVADGKSGADARAEGGREARTHGGGRRTKNYASSFFLTFILFRSRDKMVFHDKGLYV
jgi:hypothetical protein